MGWERICASPSSASRAHGPLQVHRHQPAAAAGEPGRATLPGTFEHAVDHLLEHAIDFSGFDARFRNDATGAPAYPPAVLLKVVLCAYARGVVSSRAIARLCEAHVTFIARCGTRTPHLTTIAAFVSALGPDIAHVFAAVLAVCDQHGLIGREMSAIDSVKLPSNASKRRSGRGSPSIPRSGGAPKVPCA